jgi:hypothetical protein
MKKYKPTFTSTAILVLSTIAIMMCFDLLCITYNYSSDYNSCNAKEMPGSSAEHINNSISYSNVAQEIEILK